MTDRQDENHSPEISSSILARAIVHDVEAWSTLVTIYAPLIYSWCRNWHLSPEDAERVGERVLDIVYLELNRFRNNQLSHSFRQWLLDVTRSAYLEHLLQSGDHGDSGSHLPASLNGEIPDRASLQSDPEADNHQLFLRAFDAVKPHFTTEEWRAFWLLVIEKRAGSEVASELRIPEEIVYLAKARVLRRLRQDFSELLEF